MKQKSTFQNMQRTVHVGKGQLASKNDLFDRSIGFLRFLRLYMRSAICLLMPALVSAPAVAEVSESISYKSYVATKPAETSLLVALNRASPIRQDGNIYHGYARWHVEWRHYWNNDGSGNCRITKVATTLKGEITLPDLISSDSRAQSQFSSYLQSLRQHEAGHIQIASAVANQIDAGIQSLPSMTSCDVLNQAANRLGNEYLEAARLKEREYDKQTQHGCKQGACLDQRE